MEAAFPLIIITIIILTLVALRRKPETLRTKKEDNEWFMMEISVPSTTKMEPTAATGLVATLFKLHNPEGTVFSIIAKDQRILYQIIVPSHLVEQVGRAILSFYPQADIHDYLCVPNPVPPNSITMQFFGAMLFAPFAYADDFRLSDPLAGVVGAMSHLEEGEVLNYALTIQPGLNAHWDWNASARASVHKSSWPLLLEAVAIAAANKHAVYSTPRPLDKFRPNIQRLAEDKAEKPMVQATFKVFVNASSIERRNSIMESLKSAVCIFDRDGSNVLVDRRIGIDRVDKKFLKEHQLILCPQEVAAFWHLPTEHIRTQGVVWSSGAKAPLPVELLQKTGDIFLGNNTYQSKTRPVYLGNPDRVTHMNIVGKTRVGKTTFMHNLIHQDIAAGRGVSVIDPHGDLVRDILESSIPPEREDDVVLFDLADIKYPFPLNLLYVPPGVSHHAAVGLTLGVLKKIFAEQWSATRMEDALYSALAVLVDYDGATIRDIPKVFLDQDFRSEVLSQARDEVALEYFYNDYEQMSERYQLEVARPIMNRIRAFYRNPVIRAIVDQPNSIDMRSIMDNDKIFLASLAGEATQAESSIIGALLISKIQMAAMGRASMSAEQRRMCYLYIDEVQNFVTTSLPVMFSEAAKYALSLTVANQFLRQLAGDTLEAVLGNTGTTVMFACGLQDAKDLGAYVKPVFDSETLLNLDRFHTIVKMQKNGKTLSAFNMQTLEPPAKPEDATETAERIRNKALKAYNQVVTEKPEQLPESPVPERAVSPTDPDEGNIPSLQL